MQGLNDITAGIIEEAIYIHRYLGPGLLESVYEAILYDRLSKAGFVVDRQVEVPVIFDGINYQVGFRADLFVNDAVIVEIKSVETIKPVHLKQVLTYLKLTHLEVGLLINFNEEVLKNGLKRVVNNFGND